MSRTLSFEEHILTNYDWIQKTQEPQAAVVAQDDYDDGVQKIYVTLSDGTRLSQRRQWAHGEDHDEYLRLAETEGEQQPTPAELMAFIEEHSELLDEEDLPPDYSFDSADTATPTVVAVSAESIDALSMELRHHLMTDFTKGLASFGGLTGMFERFMANRRMRKELDFDFNAFESFAAKLQTKNHMELLDLRFFVPPGMRSSYVELFKTLLECQEYAEKTLNEVILPLKVWVSTVYNEPERLKSVRNTEPVKTIDPTKLSKQLSAACSFSGQAQRPYGDCFERAEDLTTVNEQLRELAGRYSVASIERFDSETKALASAFSLLGQRISVLDDSKVSVEIANSLATYIHRVARQIEFYAVYNTVMRATLEALKQSQEHWERQVLR